MCKIFELMFSDFRSVRMKTSFQKISQTRMDNKQNESS